MLAAHAMKPGDVDDVSVGSWRAVLSHLATEVSHQCDDLHDVGFDHDRTRKLLGWVEAVRVELERDPRPRKTARLIEEGRNYLDRLAKTRYRIPVYRPQAESYLRRRQLFRKGLFR